MLIYIYTLINSKKNKLEFIRVILVVVVVVVVATLVLSFSYESLSSA